MQTPKEFDQINNSRIHVKNYSVWILTTVTKMLYDTKFLLNFMNKKFLFFRKMRVGSRSLLSHVGKVTLFSRHWLIKLVYESNNFLWPILKLHEFSDPNQMKNVIKCHITKIQTLIADMGLFFNVPKNTTYLIRIVLNY